uniref:MSP domain-containing protein n=1 Tax=Strongyloides stercoralis TaxID=6248 RepID=A0A0K0DYJ7_STRER
MQKHFEKIYSTILYNNTTLESPILFRKEKNNSGRLAVEKCFLKTNNDDNITVILKNNEKKINCLLIVLDNGKKLLDQIKNRRMTISEISKIPDNYLWFKSNVIYEEITFSKKNVL